MPIRTSLKWRLITLCVLAIAVFSYDTAGQKPASKTAQDLYGRMDDQIYTNSLLGFKLTIPTGYTIIPTKQAEFYADAGIDTLKDREKGSAKKVDDVVAKQSMILAVAVKPLGSPANAVVEFIVVKQTKGATAKMSLASSVSLMTNNMKYRFVDSVTGSFGGKSLPGAVLEVDVGTVTLKQRLFAINRGEYVMLIGAGSTNDQGMDKLLSLLQGLRFLD